MKCKRFEVSNSTNKIYREGLSAEGEKVLFGFQVADSNKIISICMADDESYIVYRFGTRDKIELQNFRKIEGIPLAILTIPII